MNDDLNNMLEIPPESSEVPGPSGPSSVGDFFAFRKMISPDLIRFAYVLGVIIITVYGLAIMFGQVGPPARYGYGIDHSFTGITYGLAYIEAPAGDYRSFFFGLLIVVLGNLIWRVVCESWILFFSMHEVLRSVDRQLRRR
jgi:hypothetical protein